MKGFFLPRSEHNYEQRFTLDGSDYLIRFTWNGRVRRWYYNIRDAEGNQITADRKLVADWPLMAEIPADSNPPGQLWSISTTLFDPGIFDLNTEFLLAYIEEADL